MISNKGKIAVIGAVGVPACYGGFETLVENLVNMDTDGLYSVFCSSKSYKQRPPSFHTAKLHYIPLYANGIQSIFYDSISIIVGIYLGYRHFLILGVSGIWIVPILRLISINCRFVVNIDGVEWKRDKWGWLSSKFLKFCELIAVKFCHVVITDNEAIRKYVLNVYKTESKVIAYGGDHVQFTSPVDNLNLKSDDKCTKALSICRIEPENNVHIILQTFKQIGAEYKLTFIGNWDNSEYGKELKKEFASTENISLLDPIYSLDKLNYYRSSCDIYIHGHSAGGTNPSLVEMMFYKKEIFAFDCEFNFFTMEGNGTYFRSCEELIALLKYFDKNMRNDSPDSLFRLAQRNYTWNAITKAYKDVFVNLV